MSNHKEIFNSSYLRVQNSFVDGMTFTDAFYLRFVSSSDEVPERFKDSNAMLIKEMLQISLAHNAVFDSPKEQQYFHEKLTKKHNRHHVTPELYWLWLDCLLETVKAYDPDFNEEIDESWRRTLTPGIEFMISHSPQK